MADNNSNYLTFDGRALKQTIIRNLNESGIFTDQVYDGSNLSSLVDIIALTFSNMMFYLNKTSSESLFTEAQLYENINRIVKTLDYYPVGKQTSTLFFQASANNTLPTGNYVIPRYSFFRIGSIFYSFNNDVWFTKNEQVTELSDISNNTLLYEGKFIEYPQITARGEKNEKIFLSFKDEVKVDHFNIHVYIKRVDGNWEQWKQTNSLYLENSTSKSYTLRLNPRKKYEIVFGDDVNGAALNSGDLVSIFYLQSSGEDGEVSVGALDETPITLYSGGNFSAIFQDVSDGLGDALSQSEASLLLFYNSEASSSYFPEEGVESIRKNAPNTYSQQFRVVTTNDYKSVVTSLFSNFIQDVEVLSNDLFLEYHMKYFYNIGMKTPDLDYRVLVNQIQYADSCNTNNIYMYLLPKFRELIYKNSYENFVNPAQKIRIKTEIESKMSPISKLVFMDPIYIGINIGISNINSSPTLNDINNTKLNVDIKRNVIFDKVNVKELIRKIFLNYFTITNLNFGMEVDVLGIYNQIMNIDQIDYIETENISDSRVFKGLSCIYFNPVYPSDINSSFDTISLSPVQIPYFDGLDDFINNRINIITSK